LFISIFQETLVDLSALLIWTPVVHKNLLCQRASRLASDTAFLPVGCSDKTSLGSAFQFNFWDVLHFRGGGNPPGDRTASALRRVPGISRFSFWQAGEQAALLSLRELCGLTGGGRARGRVCA